jgi:hypothetical protein
MSDGGDGTWMTKREIAAVRRISIASADRLIRRHGWRKQPGNDGRVRTYVPSDWATAPEAAPTNVPSDISSDIPSDISRQNERFLAGPTDIRSDVQSDIPSDIFIITKAFEAAIASLTERAQTAEQRADRLQEELRRAEITLAVERAAARSWLFRLWRR